MHGDIEDGTVGRVYLAQRRRCGHLRRQLARGRGDGRLHILRSAIDAAVEIELDRDRGRALCARRTHRRHAINDRELAFERRGHGCRHGFGVGAGQACRHTNGRKIDVRQFADRQRRIAKRAEDQQRRHDQDRHDRAADERFGNVHVRGLPPPACGFEMVTSMSGTNRNCPSVTTRSPAFTLPAIAAWTPSS